MLLRRISLCALLLLIGLVSGEPDPQDDSIHFVARLRLGSIMGRVDFIKEKNNGSVVVRHDLKMDDGSQPEEFKIQVNEFPVDYTIEDKCGRKSLGKKLVDVSSLLGDRTEGKYAEALITEGLELTGKKSIWGRSLVVMADGKTSCATIQALRPAVRTLEARFLKSVGGSVFIRTLDLRDESISTLQTELFDLGSDGTPRSSDHKWKIYTTDILGTGTNRGSCGFLQLMYDPDVRGEDSCNKDRPETCAVGDLYGKHGKLRVATRKGSFGSKKLFTDTSLMLPSTRGRRKLYLVLLDKDYDDSIYACAELREIQPVKSEVRIRSHGVNGTLSFQQDTPFDPTLVQVHFQNLRKMAKGFHIHSYPVPPKRTAESKVCSDTAGHYNPFGVNIKESPTAGTGSHDKYEVGDLSGKHGFLDQVESTRHTFIDANLPMFGVNSIMGRSIVVHYTNGSRWVCGNMRYKGELRTAVAQFTYPLAGRIIFRQPADDPLADTTVFVEYLLYNDGTKNDSDSHRWHVHVVPPGRDYYNWTMRCMSALGHYNPYNVGLSKGYETCSGANPFRCELGDLVKKHKRLNVVATKKRLSNTKQLFTDPHLPLSGPNNVVGRSIVIHDDNAPEHRGDRMACTSIYRKFRHKAVAKKWVKNEDGKELKWDLKMTQDTEYDLTNVEFEFDELGGDKSGYHVHKLPVPREVKFSCLNSEVSGHFNPLNVEPKRLNPRGTPDQYEIGDLSGKWGALDRLQKAEMFFNDTNLPLFGVNSVTGRSIVVHKDNGDRWACGSLELGYAPSEARQVSAIASFHHPNGFSYGYVRFRQVIYEGGDHSDTTIEVNLRYPGENDANVTTGHSWEIWVNPVSQDAVVKSFNARCSAGGYIWNPYLIQLADPLNREFYNEECGPEVPHRCEVGDITRRQGPLTLGGPRRIYNDANLPLGPLNSIVGRSLVIYDKKGSGNRMTCANVEYDYDIFKFGNIQTPPNFLPSRFINHIRDILGVPPWMVELDMRHLKYLHDMACVQFKIHFMGPIAHKLESDFNKLMNVGELPQPSLSIPGALPRKGRKTKFSYDSCSSLQYDTKYNNIPYGGYGSGSSTIAVNFVISGLSFLLAKLL